MATTLRDVRSANRHSGAPSPRSAGRSRGPHLRARRLRPGGGGDGFAAGFIYGLLAGETPEQALRLGWAHGALVTGYPGDTTMATLAQVRAVAAGGAARIQR